MAVCDLTSNILQRDGNARRHLTRGPKRPVAELLIRTNTWSTKTILKNIIRGLTPGHRVQSSDTDTAGAIYVFANEKIQSTV